MQARVLIARYRRFDPCEACDGTRLQREARAATLLGVSLPVLGRQVREWVQASKAGNAATPAAP